MVYTNNMTSKEAAAMTSHLTTRQLTDELWGRYCPDAGPIETYRRILDVMREMRGRVDDAEYDLKTDYDV